MGNAKENIGLILLAQIRPGHDLIGERHALAVAEDTAHQTDAVNFRILDALHPELHHTVVHGNRIAGLQILVQILIVDAHQMLVTFHLPGGKGKIIPLCHGDLSCGKGTNPVLRALGIQHDGDGQAQLLANALNQFNLLFVLRIASVGEIQPGDVHACQTHLGQSLFVLAGRANGADNLCFTHP